MAKPKSPSNDRDTRLLLAEIVQLHLIQKPPLTQAQIAERLKLDRATVSRALKKAREDGLYTVHLNVHGIEAAEARLRSAFNLIDCRVVPVWESEEESERPLFTRELGRAAARYLEESTALVKDYARVGITCGATISDLIVALRPYRFNNLQISPLTIETTVEGDLDQSPFALVAMLLAKTGAAGSKRPSAYAVQPLKELLEEKTAQEAYQRHITEIFERAKELDVAIVGVGTGTPEKGAFGEAIREGGLKRDFKTKGIVGEVANRPFDEKGEDCYDGFDALKSRVRGVPLDTLRGLVRKNKAVLAIAGGRKKHQAIRVAAENQLFNYLVTDLATAEALCEGN